MELLVQQGPVLLLSIVALVSVAALALLSATGSRGGGRSALLRERLAQIRAIGASSAASPEEAHGIVAGAGSRVSVLRKLEIALRRADIDASAQGFLAGCAAFGLLVFLALFVAMAGEPVIPALAALVAGTILPWRFLVWRETRLRKRFSENFPEALDVIVRGVKAGLPLIDCIKIIASDAPQPVQGQFRRVIEDQAIGMSVDQAVEALAERMPTSEAKFFAIVIGINTRTGGNLSEALGNLSNVIRERKKMKAKIKALSAEAKASAMIVGSMPVVVGGLVYLTSPNYISLLFTNTSGNIALVASALWMCVGMLVMRKMTNFEV